MGDECEACPGAGPGPPPPQFLVPPPPRPPFLPDDESCLQEDQLPEDICDALPVIDAELHSGPALPSLAVIAVSAAILAAVVLIAGVLAWKYKRKPPVLMPCKPSAQGIDPGTMGYDDLPGAHVAARQMRASAAQHQPEMIDMKANVYPNGYRGPEEPTVFICSDPYSKEELYNPVYQELSPVSTERGESDLESEMPVSEDDFAEDELSLGEVGPRRPHHHPHQPAQGRAPPPPPPHRRAPPPPHPALAAGTPPLPFHNRPEHRRHGGPGSGPGSGAGSDFHEGLLVDALLQHQHHQPPLPLPLSLSASQHYASAPCYRLPKPPPDGALAETSFSTFRPPHQPPTSHDSDSGYSHNTSSGHHGPRSATGSLKMS